MNNLADQKLALAYIKVIMRDITLTGYDRHKIGKISWQLRAFNGVSLNTSLGEALNRLNKLLPNVKNGEIDYSWLENQVEKIEQAMKEPISLARKNDHTAI